MGKFDNDYPTNSNLFNYAVYFTQITHAYGVPNEIGIDRRLGRNQWNDAV